MDEEYRQFAANTQCGGWPLANEFNVLALIKGEERFVFVYDDPSRAALIDTFRDLASDPTLSLTWFDALVLTKKAREQGENAPAPRTEEIDAPRSRI